MGGQGGGAGVEAAGMDSGFHGVGQALCMFGLATEYTFNPRRGIRGLNETLSPNPVLLKAFSGPRQRTNKGGPREPNTP